MHDSLPAAIKHEIVDRLVEAGLPADTRIDLEAVADRVLTSPEQGHVLAVSLAEFWDITHRHIHIPATPDRSLDLARHNLEGTTQWPTDKAT